MKFLTTTTAGAILATLLLATCPAFAYYTVQDTGTLLKPSQMQFGAESQFITHGDDTGVNIIGRFDKGLTDEMNLRFEFGAGTTDLDAGAYVKWVPFPDTDKQPAVGFTAGGHYAHYNSHNEIAIRIIPFASKIFNTDIGVVTPYIAVPFAFANYNDDSRVPLELVFGSRFKSPDVKVCEFSVEIGFDVHDAPNSITFGAIFPAFE